MSAVLQHPETDFIARLADAWDGKGGFVFRRDEKLALVGMAHVPIGTQNFRWSELDGEQRQKLLFAARRCVEFGRQCAWVFGEGQGARF